MELSEKILGDLIEPFDFRNVSADNNISGVDLNKQFISTRANLEGVDITNYKRVPSKCFAANFMHIGRDIKLPVAYNAGSEDMIVSPAYTTFKLKSSEIIEEFLFMIMRSEEFDRLTWFYTDSSVRGNLDWSRFCSISIKLPSLPLQQSIVDIYNALYESQAIAEKLKSLIKELCPVLIRQSLSEQN